MSRRDDIERLIKAYNRRLQKLKEQKASFSLHAPPYILTEIEDIEAKLEDLHSELADSDASDKSSIPPTAPKASRDFDSSSNPLSFRNVFVGIIITIVGGFILAFIIQDARFTPTPTPSPTITLNTPTLQFTDTPVPTPIPTNTTEQTAKAELTVTAQVVSLPTFIPTLTLTPTAELLSHHCTVLLRGGFEYLWKTREDVRQRLGCPEKAEVSGKAWEQQFEKGKIYWSSLDNNIYVLNGTTGTWASYKNTYQEGEYFEPIEPPQGRYVPERGFRKLMQDQPELQAELGWATRPFVEMSDPFKLGAYQPFKRGHMLYSWGLDGQECRIHVLFDDKTFVSFRDTRGPGC